MKFVYEFRVIGDLWPASTTGVLSGADPSGESGRMCVVMNGLADVTGRIDAFNRGG